MENATARDMEEEKTTRVIYRKRKEERKKRVSKDAVDKITRKEYERFISRETRLKLAATRAVSVSSAQREHERRRGVCE